MKARLLTNISSTNADSIEAQVEVLWKEHAAEVVEITLADSGPTTKILALISLLSDRYGINTVHGESTEPQKSGADDRTRLNM